MEFSSHSKERIPVSSLAALAAVGAWSILALGVALLLAFGLKAGILAIGVAAFLAAAFVAPIPQSLMFYFLYLLCDGALKILSSYHPLVHVGQDIFLLSLVLRTYVDGEGDGIRAWMKTPFLVLFLLFAAAVFVQYLNPFSLGVLPSLAGTKIYLSGILLFFLVYQHIHPRHVTPLFVWIVALGAMEATIANVEYIFFPEQIFQLHPKYRTIAGEKFVGTLYRPFGTTSAPGAPSLWVFLCAPFACYLLTEARRWWQRGLALTFFAVGIPTLVFCQTRAAMVLFAAGVGLSFLAPTRRVLPKLILMGAAAGGFYTLSQPAVLNQLSGAVLDSAGLDLGRREAVEQRLSTLSEKTTYANSRGGSVARMSDLFRLMPWGIGLSHLGAASAVWKDRIEADKYFGVKWAFADNVYLAIFTELGLPGLSAWLLLVGTLVLYLLRKSFASRVPRRRALLWVAATVPLIALLGGVGSEGILYMPVGAFFWTSLAVGLRESAYV